MIDNSNYKVLFHSKDERLNYGGRTSYCEFYEIFDGDKRIGSVCEEVGEAYFLNDSYNCLYPDGNTVCPIHFIAIENDRLIVRNTYTHELISLREIEECSLDVNFSDLDETIILDE